MSVDESKNPCPGSMQDCNKAASLVNKYLDDLLDDSEKTFISKHLLDCPGCSHGYEFESSFHIRMRSLAPIAMPIEIKENILLSLGFPGISSPISGSFSAVGSPDATIAPEISSQMGIPKGSIPKGDIPKSDFFRTNPDSSATQEPGDD